MSNATKPVVERPRRWVTHRYATQPVEAVNYLRSIGEDFCLFRDGKGGWLLGFWTSSQPDLLGEQP